MNDDDDLDFELELAEAQHKKMERSKLLLQPCDHCGVLPTIEEKDLYGYPRTISHAHLEGCIFDEG
jgi:hypothetical protein